MSVLGIHHTNRTSETTEPLSVPAGLLASDVTGIVNAFSANKSARWRPAANRLVISLPRKRKVLIAAACRDGCDELNITGSKALHNGLRDLGWRPSRYIEVPIDAKQSRHLRLIEAQ